ncbi:MAG: lipoyl(octanoyl) transferase LipB [Fimbriimonadales bacterium]
MALLVDLGRMEYRACWDLQQKVHAMRVAANIPDTLLLVEHDAVLTHGASFDPSNLLFSEDQYRERGIQVERTDRGGDVTYHGPKQLVMYPIFDVRDHGGDLHKWLRDLEETMIRVLSKFDLEGYRFPPHTGVWANNRKVAAIGIRVSRWVSMHGIALNCDNDLTPFSLIIPCGIKGYDVTSLSRETGREVSSAEAMPHVVSSFSDVFGLSFTPTPLEELIGQTA